MKIRCDSCHSRYAIPDARVIGRVLKVRCKQCSEVMEVIGPTEAYDPDVHSPPPTLTRVRPFIPGLNLPDVTAPPVSFESRPVWFAAIAGKPHGPYTQGEVLSLVDRGDIHARTRLWQPPWREWERICECAALRWAYEAVVDRTGRQIANLVATEHEEAMAAQGLVTDGGGYFPDPTLQSGWVILDAETQRYLETCARRGWALEPEPAVKEPRILTQEMIAMGTTAHTPSTLPAAAMATAAAFAAIAGALALVEAPLRIILGT